jgi:hypothetical protein
MKRSHDKKKPGDTDPAQALYDDAREAARSLKRNHSTLCERDLDGFRAIIRKAHSRVFRRKPGPKADPRVGTAARERARGAVWEELYTKHIDHYGQMPEYTRAYAESGFRRKVNGYLQRHPLLHRKLRQRSTTKTGDSGA